MDKKQLVRQISEQLEVDVKIAHEAALATYDAATNEESKPENEYDTRALEASYLAGAQAKRVQEIEAQISLYKYLEIRPYPPGSRVGPTALVELECDGQITHVFMMPKGGGGFQLQFENKNIQVVTPASPLGEALVGLKIGDVAVVETGRQTKEYEIINIE